MLINRKYFAKYSPLPIPDNYDYSEIMNYVPVATEIWVRPLLGGEFLDELEDQIENNTVTDANAALLTEGLLWQYLCYATCLEGLVFIWAHFSQTGISLGKSDNSDSITLKDLTYVEAHLRRQVEFLKESVKKYVIDHIDFYPKVCTCDCECNCCNAPKLQDPNPYKQLYSTCRKNIRLK